MNNIPSLHADTIDAFVNRPMVAEMFNIVGFQIPGKVAAKHQNTLRDKLGLDKLGIRNIGHNDKMYAKLRSEEDENKCKKFMSEEMSPKECTENILGKISSFDARTIIISEDEFSQTKKWTRIFPTSTTYQYLQYLPSPSYSDHLLGKWEAKYGTSREKREEGIELIKDLCENKYHLIAPPIK